MEANKTADGAVTSEQHQNFLKMSLQTYAITIPKVSNIECHGMAIMILERHIRYPAIVPYKKEVGCCYELSYNAYLDALYSLIMTFVQKYKNCSY